MTDLKPRNDIKISVDVLNGLSPQRQMSNAKKEDIDGQTFVLHSLIGPDSASNAKGLNKLQEDTSRFKVKYVNSSTGQAFLLPIRSLLNLEIADGLTLADGENEDYVAEDDTKKRRVHEYLTTEMESGKDISLLQEFKVVSVEPRKQQGTDNLMYPAYCYKKFNDRIDEVNQAHKDSGAEGRADLGEIYGDFTFMNSLYAHQNL